MFKILPLWYQIILWVVLPLSSSTRLAFAFCGITTTTMTTTNGRRRRRRRSARIVLVRQAQASSLPDDQSLQQIFLVAVDASKKAGEIILKHADGADVVETKSTSRDLLTLVDPMCEKVCLIQSYKTNYYYFGRQLH